MNTVFESAANSAEATDSFDARNYNASIDALRSHEYLSLSGTIYLDHAGTTPYAKSLVEAWSNELSSNLFGNPHSASASSQLSTRRIEEVRLRVLRHFKADPDQFDVVFVANATAGMKLVAEAFRDIEAGFRFLYHEESHTSLVGCRELASLGSKCFASGDEVDQWIDQQASLPSDPVSLFAFAGQSNMTGRKLPLKWCQKAAEQQSKHSRIYTLLDAASLAATSPLDLKASTAADFTCISFYKIFGLPDLGGLIVKKSSAHILMTKKYFAGGTVDAVTVDHKPWYARKMSISAALEEGTLPFHNILALDHAMTVHERLFKSMDHVSRHTSHLANHVRLQLNQLKHANGTKVIQIYGNCKSARYGPIVAFNILDSKARFISSAEVEKLCIVKGIQLRTGSLCNPGGAAKHFELTNELIRKRYDQGSRCGSERDLFDGQPMGSIRVSFGAMSTMNDVNGLLEFINEYFVDDGLPSNSLSVDNKGTELFVEELAIYPIKSCGSFIIPRGKRWPITKDGLVWDRKWCLVQEGTNVVLSQKSCPRMAMLNPIVDLERHKLVLAYHEDDHESLLEIPLDEEPYAESSLTLPCGNTTLYQQEAKVCGDVVTVMLYRDPRIKAFFSDILKISCTLARYPRRSPRRDVKLRQPKEANWQHSTKQQVGLANESPLLIVSRSSIDYLNSQIKERAKETNCQAKYVSSRAFRANIVLGNYQNSSAYAEDSWTSLAVCSASAPQLTDVSSSNSSNSRAGSTSADSFTIGPRPEISYTIDILGPCQRCQMVSIDQSTAKSQLEPFSTLAKTRRKGDGRVWFGVHASLSGTAVEAELGNTLMVGDRMLAA
jgi:molybdenum cofactor sulfurtransferase